MYRWVLVGIVILAFVLRIVGLSDYPSGFHADEASFGYDAYSILKTGRDQWGNLFPLVLKSFGDDKLPVFTYLAMPSVFIFGLNEFAVRLPGAIIGTLAVFAIYLLTKEITKTEKLALTAGFLMAINPWHIMLSRGAFESNLTNLFLPLAIYFFVKGNKFLWISLVLFILNLFTYHTARILTPVVFLFLIAIYKDRLRISKKFSLSIIFAVILVLISLSGIILGGSRIATSSLADINFLDDRYRAYLSGENQVFTKIFYNQPLYVLRQFVNNFLSYFSPQFLFLNGVGEATYGMMPGIGVFYLVEVVFLIGFLIKVVKDKLNKETFLILFLTFISFIPAALTKGPGYAGNRSAIAIAPLVIMMAVGANFTFGKLKNRAFLYLFILIFLCNFIYVGERYFIGQRANNAKNMTYGMRQVFGYLENFHDKKIVISRAITEPQIFVAFYNKINPADFQKATRNWEIINGWVDQQGNYSLLNYTFRDINYNTDKTLENTILVSVPRDFPSEATPDFVVNYPNQEAAYYIFVNKGTQ